MQIQASLKALAEIIQDELTGIPTVNKKLRDLIIFREFAVKLVITAHVCVC